jgi:hypothetical protein
MLLCGSNLEKFEDKYVIYLRKLTYRDQQQILSGNVNAKFHLNILEDTFWKGFIEISYTYVSVSE